MTFTGTSPSFSEKWNNILLSVMSSSYREKAGSWKGWITLPSRFHLTLLLACKIPFVVSAQKGEKVAWGVFWAQTRSLWNRFFLLLLLLNILDLLIYYCSINTVQEYIKHFLKWLNLKVFFKRIIKQISLIKMKD